eukprot:836882-Pleurochrysis_carterae.AAC.1
MRGQTKKFGRQSLYFASYSSAKWSAFWAIDGGCKSEIPSRRSSFQGYDMGYPASNKDNAVYPEWLSLNIIPLRPSREI